MSIFFRKWLRRLWPRGLRFVGDVRAYMRVKCALGVLLRFPEVCLQRAILGFTLL